MSGAALCAVLLAVFSLLFVSSEQIPQDFIPAFVIAVSVLCSFAAGFVTAKISKKRGLLCGMLSGLLLFLLFLAAGLIAFKEPLDASSCVKMLIMAISGAIGGFLAVNKKHKRK